MRSVTWLIGVPALAANLASILIPVKYKDGDANVSSVWLCSRNGAIGNVAVMLVALGVWGTETGWPDVLVAVVLAALFLQSATKILRQALKEWRDATGTLRSGARSQPPFLDEERLLVRTQANERYKEQVPCVSSDFLSLRPSR